MGMLHRQVYAQMPPKVEYSLTELGWLSEQMLRQFKACGKQMALRFKDRRLWQKHSENGQFKQRRVLFAGVELPFPGAFEWLMEQTDAQYVRA
jgi:HxlR-like helix-turn-helix